MDANQPQTVKFNVGGRHFEVSRALIEQPRAGSTLQRMVTARAIGQDERAAVFIDRDGDTFAQVLNFLRHDGNIVLPVSIPKEMFLRDLDFYGIAHDDEGVCRIASSEDINNEVNEEMNILQDRVLDLTAVEITGPDHSPVYARGQLHANGHFSSLGPRGQYWTEWLQQEIDFPLDMLCMLEVWIGGTLRGGFSDNFEVLSWTKLGQKGPLIFICSRPGNLVLSVNFGWTKRELETCIDTEAFYETKDDHLLQFISEDLARENPSKTCTFVSVSLPTSRNRLLGPVDSPVGIPENIIIG